MVRSQILTVHMYFRHISVTQISPSRRIPDPKTHLILENSQKILALILLPFKSQGMFGVFVGGPPEVV